MKDKKKIIITVFCVLSVLLIAFGVTYSIFTYTKLGNTENTITTGKLTFIYTENTGTGTGINITDAFPISDELGKAYSSDNQVFNFKVESEIVGEAQIPYEVTVAKTASSTLDEEYIKIYLTDTTETEETTLLEPTLYSDLPTSSTSEDEKQIYFDIVEENEDYEKDFRLRMWIAEGTNQEAINDKLFTVKVGVYSPAEKMEANTKLYTIANDVNSNGIADIGDEIVLGSEHFHVISNDETNINALAKYNLYVGGEYNGSWTAYENPTGIQDSEMVGYSSTTPFKGTIAFSNLNQKGTEYSDYEGSIVEGYVNDYINYLNTNNPDLNATGRLITLEELKEFGCLPDSYTCSAAPSWIYTTSYWTGSANNKSSIWFVTLEGAISRDSYNNRDGFGVRPVITIAA